MIINRNETDYMRIILKLLNQLIKSKWNTNLITEKILLICLLQWIIKNKLNKKSSVLITIMICQFNNICKNAPFHRISTFLVYIKIINVFDYF